MISFLIKHKKSILIITLAFFIASIGYIGLNSYNSGAFSTNAAIVGGTPITYRDLYRATDAQARVLRNNGVDVDERKISMLREGEIPIYEPGLKEMVLENSARGHLHFTTDIEEALQEATVCFIAVGTPMGEDGSADLSYVEAVARDIGRHMVRHMYVVDKSTVPVGRCVFLIKFKTVI